MQYTSVRVSWLYVLLLFLLVCHFFTFITYICLVLPQQAQRRSFNVETTLKNGKITSERRWKKGFIWKLFQRHNFNVISTQFQPDFNIISSMTSIRRCPDIMMSFFLVKTTSKIRRWGKAILRLADVATRFQPYIHVETTLCAHWDGN